MRGCPTTRSESRARLSRGEWLIGEIAFSQSPRGGNCGVGEARRVMTVECTRSRKRCRGPHPAFRKGSRTTQLNPRDGAAAELARPEDQGSRPFCGAAWLLDLGHHGDHPSLKPRKGLSTPISGNNTAATATLGRPKSSICKVNDFRHILRLLCKSCAEQRVIGLLLSFLTQCSQNLWMLSRCCVILSDALDAPAAESRRGDSREGDPGIPLDQGSGKT